MPLKNKLSHEPWHVCLEEPLLTARLLFLRKSTESCNNTDSGPGIQSIDNLQLQGGIGTQSVLRSMSDILSFHRVRSIQHRQNVQHHRTSLSTGEEDKHGLSTL